MSLENAFKDKDLFGKRKVASERMQRERELCEEVEEARKVGRRGVFRRRRNARQGVEKVWQGDK